MRYLDHAATTPVRPEAVAAMAPWLTSRFGNPSSTHELGQAAATALAQARGRLAAIVGMRRSDVVLTSGGTEANNLAIKGIAVAALLQRGARHLVVSPIEHESVLASADYLRRAHGFEITELPVGSTGRIDPAAVTAALRADTALVSIGYANNEIGTVQDVPAIAAAAHAQGVLLHVDAVQAAGWLPLDADLLGADALSLAGHKVGAPTGTGLLAVRGRVPLEPLLHGGGQERGRRSGTESVAGAVALATALDLAEAERPEAAVRVAAVRDAFIARVLSLVPAAALTGDSVHRHPASASFTFAGTSGEAILLELERRGIVSSSGSACAAGRDEPSHVLTACGIPPEIAQTAVRFTLPHSAGDDVVAVADEVAASVAAVAG